MIVKGYSWARVRPLAAWIKDHAAAEAAGLLFILTLTSLSVIAVQSLGFHAVYGWFVANTQWLILSQLLLGAFPH